MLVQRFQTKFASRSFVLPLILLICTIVYIIMETLYKLPDYENTSLFWQLLIKYIPGRFVEKIISYICFGLIGYLLFEMNNVHSIIRTRTTVHVAFYFLLVTAMPFLYSFQPGDLIALCLVLTIHTLFWSNMKKEPVLLIFQAMVFVGLGSLLFPQLLYFVPVLLLGIFYFKVLSWRTFWAGIVGLLLPYWFLLGHAFFYDKMELFYAPFIELVTFEPIDYSNISTSVLYSLSVTVFLLIVGAIRYLFYSYQDRIRTRVFLNFLLLLAIVIITLILLKPNLVLTLLHLLLPVTAIFIGHFFALTNSRASNLFFIFVLILILALGGINIWML